MRTSHDRTARERRALRAGFLVVALMTGAAVARPAAASPEAGSPSTAREQVERYRLDLSGLADPLRQDVTAAAADTARRWSGPDLEAEALRLRDVLARRGDAAATVRLRLVRGVGKAPGIATITVARELDASGAPGGSTSASQAPEPFLPVVRSVAPLPGALADSVSAAYLGASRGGASIDAVASGLSAARDVLIAAGYYGADVGLDSLALSSERGEPAAASGDAEATEGRPGRRAYLRVDAGLPARFETLDLPGATSMRPGAASSIAGLRPGRMLTPAVLSEARERLVGSGLFTVVGDPRLLPGTTAGGARVAIPVEEERLSRFEGAIGIAREGGVTGLLDLALGNIAGSGRSAGLRWHGPGNGHSEYAARYREPTLFKGRADATLALDAQVADSLFTQTRWSLAVGAGPPATRASLALIRSGSVYSGLARGSSATWSVAGRAAFDRLRPSINPVGGLRVLAGGEAGRREERFPGVERTTRRLFRGDLSLEAARSLGSRRVLYAAAKGVGAFFPGDAFPAEELLFVGGGEGLRGHRDRAFAGSRIASGTLEHRWITDERGGRVYLFTDAARHDLETSLGAGTFALPSSLTPGSGAPSLARTVLSPGWEFGYGAGLRTRMASGLVGLELGFAPGEPLRRATIHVRYASTW